jgi:hypothetical protein
MVHLQVGESGWTEPLALESSSSTDAPEEYNNKPVLIRTRIPAWGTVHEIVARLELVGGGFERTLVRAAHHTSPLHRSMSSNDYAANNLQICIENGTKVHVSSSDRIHNCSG